MEVIYSLVGLSIVMAVIPAYIAKSKGRSFGLFLFYGLMLGPVAIIHASFSLTKPTLAIPSLVNSLFTGRSGESALMPLR